MPPTPNPFSIASSPSGSTPGRGYRTDLHTTKALALGRAAIGVLLLIAGCGKPAPKGQSGEAGATTEVKGDTTEKKPRGGLGDMFKIPEPVDEDAEPSEEDDTSDAQ